MAATTNIVENTNCPAHCADLEPQKKVEFIQQAYNYGSFQVLGHGWSVSHGDGTGYSENFKVPQNFIFFTLVDDSECLFYREGDNIFSNIEAKKHFINLSFHNTTYTTKSGEKLLIRAHPPCTVMNNILLHFDPEIRDNTGLVRLSPTGVYPLDLEINEKTCCSFYGTRANGTSPLDTLVNDSLVALRPLEFDNAGGIDIRTTIKTDLNGLVVELKRQGFNGGVFLLFVCRKEPLIKGESEDNRGRLRRMVSYTEPK